MWPHFRPLPSLSLAVCGKNACPSSSSSSSSTRAREGGDKHCLSASKIPLTSLSSPRFYEKAGAKGHSQKKKFFFPRAPKGGFGHHRRREKKDNGMNVNASLDIPLFSLPVIKLAAAFDNLVIAEKKAHSRRKKFIPGHSLPLPLPSKHPNPKRKEGGRPHQHSGPKTLPPFPPTPSDPTVGPGGKILVGQQKRILAGTLSPLPLLYFGQRKGEGLFLSRGLLAFFMAVGV